MEDTQAKINYLITQLNIRYGHIARLEEEVELWKIRFNDISNRFKDYIYEGERPLICDARTGEDRFIIQEDVDILVDICAQKKNLDRVLSQIKYQFDKNPESIEDFIEVKDITLESINSVFAMKNLRELNKLDK